jgi:hypothetical protein
VNPAHESEQLLGLCGERARSRGQILGLRRGALGHVVHPRHRLVDVLAASRLLPGGRGDLAHEVRNALGQLDDLAEQSLAFLC